MRNKGIGALVALEMDKVIESPEYVKLFTKQASSCCPIDCDCKETGGKCPCSKAKQKCSEACKSCGQNTAEAEPMKKDASQIMEEAASMILEASDLLEAHGLLNQSVEAMKILDSALVELASAKFAKDKSKSTEDEEDVNDVRIRDLFGPEKDLAIEVDSETGEAMPFEMLKEIEELESDPAYEEPELMLPEAKDAFLSQLSQRDEQRLEQRMLDQLAEWNADEHTEIFNEIDNEPIVIDLEEFDVNDSRVLERLNLPALEDDVELEGAFSDRLAESEKELLALIESLTEDEDPIITDVDDLFGLQPTLLSPKYEDELELKMAFDKLDTWIAKNASEEAEESEEESEDEDFEDED